MTSCPSRLRRGGHPRLREKSRAVEERARFLWKGTRAGPLVLIELHENV